MSLFPGKIEIISKQKETYSLTRPKKIYRYQTKSGQEFTSSNFLKKGDKVIILDISNNGENCKCFVKNYYLDCEHNILKQLSSSINSFSKKSVYYNYLNRLKGKIKCYSKEIYTEDISEDIYRVEANDIVLPIHGSFNLRNFKDSDKKVYPVCRAILKNYLFNSNRINIRKRKYLVTDKGIYYKIKDDFPYRYDATIELCKSDTGIKLPVKLNLYLYGVVEIEKWHLVVLTHYLDKIENFDYSKLPELCQKMRDERLEAAKNKKIKKRPNCDISKCIKEKVFLKGHKILTPYLKKYLNKAVTFFSDKETKKEIYIKKINKSKLGDNVVNVAILAYNSEMTLIVRGISYNWNILTDKNNRPIIHCNFVTFYSHSFKKTPDKYDYKGKLYIDKER